MADAVRIDGLRELRTALRQMEKAAPRELNKAVKEAVSDEVLPEARSDTPALSGALRGASRVGTRGDRITLRNPKPYANTIHWGRVKRGVVKGRPFFYTAILQNRDDIGRIVVDEVERFIRQRTP